jgi:hypothetical protein
VFCTNLEFAFEVTVESMNYINQRRWCTISFQDLEQELMVGSIKCFNEINKKEVGVKAVFLLELEASQRQKSTSMVPHCGCEPNCSSMPRFCKSTFKAVGNNDAHEVGKDVFEDNPMIIGGLLGVTLFFIKNSEKCSLPFITVMNSIPEGTENAV